MKNHYLLLGMALICMTACHHKTDRDASAPVPVDVAFPICDSVLISKTYPGTLSAGKYVDIVARVNGYITSKDYVSGQWVPKGKVLFRIEDRNYRDAVVQAEAALTTARGNLEYASAHYKAMTEAIKADAVSEMEVEQARSALVQAEAAVKNAGAALQIARTKLSYCTVTAPFDGHMAGAEFDPGAYVGGEGAPVKLSGIYHDKTMLATFAVEDNEALGSLRRNIEAGKIDYHHIPVRFSEETGHQYFADLCYQSPEVNTATGTMTLKGVVENPYDELKSGMYISVDLPVSSDPNAILVLDASIGSDQLGKYLYVVNDSNKVVYTPVKTGEAVRDSLRIITSGIGPRDRYVTRAIMKVRDGMEVKPVLTDSVTSQKK